VAASEVCWLDLQSAVRDYVAMQ